MDRPTSPVLVAGEPFTPRMRFVGYVVPLAIAARSDLSQLAKNLYGRLAMYAGGKSTCNPGLITLARDLGTSTDAIGRALTELKDAKLILRRRLGPNRAECTLVWNESLRQSLRTETAPDSANSRNQPRADNSVGARNLDSADSQNQDRQKKQKTPQMRGRDSAKMRSAHKEEEIFEKTNTALRESAQRDDSVFCPAGATSAPEVELAGMWFDSEFWPTYPRKVERKGARKLAVRIATTAQKRTEIMSGLRRLLPTYERTEEKFIPHPTTFLNSERWADEPTPLPVSPQRADGMSAPPLSMYKPR